MKRRFMILDGSSLMFRAFYALPLLTAPNGEYTNAVFGFSNMLIRLIADYKPDMMAVAFDKSRHTFRTEMYSEYKGTRDKTPDEFKSQVPLLREFLDCFRIPFIEIDDFEADDIIGTLSAQAAKDGGYDTFIVTGDRDALQLVRDGVSVLFTKRGISEMELYDEAAFTKKYGFMPIRLIDLKGLMGDASDNIPGVTKVGEKTATELIVKYGSVEGVYEHIDDISKKKLKEHLVEDKEKALLSKKLATIICDVPIEFSPDEYRIEPDNEKVMAFCSRYGLKAVQKNYDKLFGSVLLDFGTENNDKKIFPVKILSNSQDVDDFIKSAKQIGSFSFVPIYAENAPHKKIISMGLFADEPVAIKSDCDAFEKILLLLNDNSLERVTTDLKSYYQFGGTPSDNFFDVAIASYLVETTVGEKSIERLQDMWLPDEVSCPVDSSEQEKAAWRAMIAFKLVPILKEKIKSLGMEKLYRDMELPLVEVLSSMEKNGIYINRSNLEKQGRIVNDKILCIEKEIFDIAGHEFNINSPRQMGEVLFDELNLTPLKKTKSGKYSTNVEVLENLKNESPIIEKILSYRMWTKLKTTYIDAFDGLIDGATRRVHTTFNQTVTATGRLSSSDPNLQNIPVRKEEGKVIRSFFEPGEGYDYILSADYSQIELRVLAHFSKDKNLIDSFKKNEDIHARTASEVFGVSIDEVTPLMRRHAKAVNFGIVYGISDFGLSKGIGISRKEAAKYIENYFEKYSGVKSFIDRTVEEAHKNGFVTTMFGRRRELPSIHSKNFNERSLAERMAMNTPIQGTAADIIKLAMIRAYRMTENAHLKSRILLQVHDELVMEVAENELEQVKFILVDAMEHAVELLVPLVIDVHIGKNWAEAK